MRRCLLIACLVLGASAADGAEPDSAAGGGATLSANHPVQAFAVRDLNRSAGDRFVLVQVDEVVNPESVPLAFMVHYRLPGQEKRYLGSFALFPADNPGRFIVPTSRSVGCEGEILVSLEPIEDEAAAQHVHVTLGEVRLTDHGILGPE